MIFSPDDPGVSLVEAQNFAVNSSLITLMLIALVQKLESPQEVLENTRSLLKSVDAATTVALNSLKGDEHIENLGRQWAFWGPGIFNQLERLSGLGEICLLRDLTILAGANAFLMARKMSLELNMVDVPIVA